MKLVDAEPIIRSLLGMQHILGYDAISIDGIVKALQEAKEIEFAADSSELAVPKYIVKNCTIR